MLQPVLPHLPIILVNLGIIGVNVLQPVLPCHPIIFVYFGYYRSIHVAATFAPPPYQFCEILLLWEYTCYCRKLIKTEAPLVRVRRVRPNPLISGEWFSSHQFLRKKD